MKFLLTSAFLALAATGAQAQTVELYTGAIVAPGQLDYGPLPSNPPPNTLNMDTGLVFGGGLYWGLPGGIELGLDAMSTTRDYSGSTASTSTESLMVAGRMQFPNAIPGPLTPYVGLGLGAINVNYSDPSSPFLNGSDLVAGYQAELGLRYQLGNLQSFAALKYQGTFGDPVIQTEYVEYKSLSVITGIRW